MFRTAIFAFSFALSAGVGATQSALAQAVDLQLVLAVDTSGSVSEQRFELQKQGYVAAFRSPQLLRAIGSGTTRTIAVTMTQWTGPALQIQVMPWMLIKDEASMHAFAEGVGTCNASLRLAMADGQAGAAAISMTSFLRTASAKVS